jgi:putative ABC transport system permease protein
LEAAQAWMGLDGGATTVVLRVDSHENTDAVYERMLGQLDGQLFETQRWFDVDPFIQQIVESSDASIIFILAIVVVVVLGEIINTMFMSLYERTREFGLMEALGTGRRQLFAMLLWETTVLVSIGGALGYGGAAILTAIYGRRGIDLTAFTESLSSLYMDPIIHPVMDLKITVYILATIAVTALLAGVLPAWRATKLNPVEAMRQI